MAKCTLVKKRDVGQLGERSTRRIRLAGRSQGSVKWLHLGNHKTVLAPVNDDKRPGVCVRGLGSVQGH